MISKCPALLDQPSEIRIELGRAACEIHYRNVGAAQGLDAQLRGVARHDFAPVGPGIHVAMTASLVAQLAHIDLKNRDPSRRQRCKAGFRKRLREWLAPLRTMVQYAQLRRRGGQRVLGACEAHILTLLAVLRICSP